MNSVRNFGSWKNRRSETDGYKRFIGLFYWQVKKKRRKRKEMKPNDQAERFWNFVHLRNMKNEGVIHIHTHNTHVLHIVIVFKIYLNFTYRRENFDVICFCVALMNLSLSLSFPTLSFFHLRVRFITLHTMEIDSERREESRGLTLKG